MAKRLSIPSKHIELEIVGAHDSFLASRVQRVNTTADQAVNTIDELGNPLHAGTSKDVPNITLTFQAMDAGIKVVGALAGVSTSGWVTTSGINVSTALDRSVDAIIRVRDANVAQYVKAAHLRRCIIQSFTYNYTVDGDSTEEYTAVGSTKRWFTNDVIVDRLIGDGTDALSTSEAFTQLKNGNSAISVFVDGVYLDEVSGSPSENGTYQLTGTTLNFNTGDGPVSGAIVMVVYQSAASGDAWTDISDDTIPAAIRGKDVVVAIAASDQERVQALSVNVNFNSQPIREMGSRQIIGYLNQVPEVTGSITVLDTDTDLLALLSGSSITDTEFPMGQCAASGVALEVKLQNPADCSEPFAVLKTVYLPSVSMVSEGFTANVNDNAQQTIDWRSDDGALWVYNGART
jgi:hypothetical protein